jgi:hypothetical protein
MYSQLSYYSSLFDIKIAKEQALVEEDDTGNFTNKPTRDNAAVLISFSRYCRNN